MSKILGTAYEVGNSEVVISRRPEGGTILQEGLFVKQVDEDFVGLADGDSPFGVMAQQEAVACSVLISGMKVAVQLNDDITPSVGETVYVTSGNKATNLNTETTATVATFTGVIGVDAKSDNTTEKLTNVRWAEINMPHGL